MTSYLITNARVFDGSGAPAEHADVLVENDRIIMVADRIETGPDTRVIDGAGCVLTPGLIDGHAHLGFGSSVEHVSDRTEPDEEKVLLTAHCGRVLLDHGFTSAYSGGNRLPGAEVAVRKAFAEGWMPGPRFRAASWEGSAGMVSPGQYDFPGTDVRPSDPQSVADFVSAMADRGVDIVKLSLTGESAVVEGTSRVLQFHPEELAAAAATARERGVWLTAHAHSAEAITMAVEHGIRAIYHATFADQTAIDALAAARDRVFVAPTPGIIWAHLHDMEHPPTEGMETQETFESICRVAPELHKRGVRLVIGGDYGFGFNPIGRNARDLRLFVEWFGLSPAEALRCATEFGGQLMGLGDELGLIRPGYLADLLLVRGDPTTDITLMQDPANFALIMAGGRVHKLDPS
ncbi:amidohydrolase family protein [Actinoplanes sp. NPDC051851]|uniref:amidohydrolase family protein n=1 Tax=Actinoplanes sp. NPDC051851 TaxID=3154753 RepID=UPI003424A2AD